MRQEESQKTPIFVCPKAARYDIKALPKGEQQLQSEPTPIPSRNPALRGMHFLRLVIVLFAGCCQTDNSIIADDLTEIRSRGTLVWGADQEGGGPFVYPSADDPQKLTGFEVELADIIAGHIGVRAEFAQNQWDKLPDLLDRRDIDIVLNGYEWTQDRADRYGVSIPYYIYELQLVARKNDATIRNWNDLLTSPGAAPRRISVLGGSAAEEYLRRLPVDRVEAVLFEGVTDALRATELNVDGIDGNLQDLPIWTFYADGFPDLQSVDAPVGRGYYVAMVRKGEPELLRDVNQAILLALQDGRLRKIYEKYRMWNSTQSARALETDANGVFRDFSTNEASKGSAGKPSSASSETADDVNPSTSISDSPREAYQAVRGIAVLRQRGPLLLKSAAMTAVLAVTSMPIAVGLGLMLALARLSGSGVFRIFSTVYVEVVRGTPLVLQLYVIFFLLPEIGISIHAFWAAVLGLAINYSAYEAEIYRAGLQAIPNGQMEAALSLGMTRGLALRRIIIPQATRLVIPPMTNDFIALFKDTAVCSVITVVELSKDYYIQARSTGAIVELGILTAALYLAMSFPLSLAAGYLERRLTPDRRS